MSRSTPTLTLIVLGTIAILTGCNGPHVMRICRRCHQCYSTESWQPAPRAHYAPRYAACDQPAPCPKTSPSCGASNAAAKPCQSAPKCVDPATANSGGCSSAQSCSRGLGCCATAAPCSETCGSMISDYFAPHPADVSPTPEAPMTEPATSAPPAPEKQSSSDQSPTAKDDNAPPSAKDLPENELPE